MNGLHISILFYYLQFFYIGFPKTLGAPGNLAAGYADTAPPHNRLVTHVACGHFFLLQYSDKP